LLGDRIKQLRLDIQITQEQLARVLGKSIESIAAYETNYIQPDMETLLRLADFFEVSMDYLAGRSKLRKQFEDVFHMDFEDDEAGRLTGEILDSVQMTIREAALEKNVDWLNIVNRLYGSVRDVKIYEKPQGKLVINDEDNGVLLVISNAANEA
jgi:transcriptional regulator with XRE-family HTH domain